MRQKAELLLSMTIFGTIGLFRRWIPLPSSVLAMARAFIGMLFLLIFITLKKHPVSFDDVKKNAKHLIIAGVMLGFNWILLFEAYNYTTVATATLCYYMAPMFMIAASALILNEKISRRKWISAALAIVGMIFVTGVAEGGFTGYKGILLGLAAAVLYACIVMNNKMLKDISSYDRTIVQLAISSVILIPYVLLTEDVAAIQWSAAGVSLTAVLGIVHTGIAYALYFGAIPKLQTNEVAILSYVDPILAVILSATILGEHMSILSIAGTVVVIFSLILSETEK